MTKDNILFSIIGLLLGFIVGFMFANSANQRYGAQRAQASMANQLPGLPPDHPAIPSNAVADQPDAQGMEAVQAKIQQARNEPNNFEAQTEAARLFYQIQRYDEAIEFLMRANQLRPDDYETVVNLGNVNFDSGRYELAERWYTAALVKNPDDVNVRTDLGLTFLFREPADVDRAIKEFRGSLQRDPNHKQTLQNLTVALTRKGDAKEAQATLEKLERIDPGNQALPKLRSDLAALNSSPKQPSPNTDKGRK
ncbi:MAG TPA: tetratricopeptide repeat protein [Pyrinomonadaceae bacterium]|nr:tetratricopeptide repeat protein [Pyrinomonadaceae bacterium]